MNHRMRFFCGLAVLIVAMAALCGCGRHDAEEAEQTIELTYANFPPAATFPCVQMERWKTEVENRTAGKVRVQTFPGSTLLNPKNMFEGVEAGTADIGCFAMSYLPGRFPVSEAVDLPLGFPDAETASLTLFDLIGERDPAEFADVKIITLFTCPPANLMTSEPVKTLGDIAGVQLRVSGTGAEVIKALGATPVAMPMSDTPDAIQKGTVAGIVSSLEVLKDMNFASYCQYATRTQLHVVTFAVVMNREKWDALPDDVKEVIDELAREHSAWTGRYVDGHVDEALDWAAEEYGHEVFELTAEEQAEIARRVQPLIDGYVERVTKAGLPGREIVDRVLALKDSVEAE